jgi:hypothetical protein
MKKPLIAFLESGSVPIGYASFSTAGLALAKVVLGMHAQVEVRQLEHLDICSRAIPPRLIPSGGLPELLALDLHSSTPTLIANSPHPTRVDGRLIKRIP